jgi:hypothetical protein
MTPEKPEPNAYWHEKHGWITGLPSVNDPDFGKELNRKVQQKDKEVKKATSDKKNREESGPKLAKAMLTNPGLRNIYSDTNEEGDVIPPYNVCGPGSRGGSFTHGNGNCGCTGC